MVGSIKIMRYRKAMLVSYLFIAHNVCLLVSPGMAFSGVSAPHRRVVQSTTLASRSRSVFLSATNDKPEVAEGKTSKKRLPRAERKALERAKKGRDGKKKNGQQVVVNGGIANGRQKEQKKNNSAMKRYSLHSNRISELTLESTADDVLKSIKRAQNLHDVHDIRNIERFLLEEVDVSFAFGYRGSLLARLAVAALHLSNNDLARKAIEERRLNHRSAMLPMESSAIIRGLLRVHNVTDAIAILEDELSLPLQVSLPMNIKTQTFYPHSKVSFFSFIFGHPFLVQHQTGDQA